MQKSKPDNTRTTQVNCLFKPEEKKLIEEAAAACKVTLSFLIRQSAIANAEKIIGRKVQP
jgi:uncharacterized protein (DUF1778 family)